MAVMRKLGGAALRHYQPQHLVHLKGPDLEIAMYPASLLLRGTQKKTVLAHGLIVESLTPLSAFQTTATEAQDLERQIRQVWSVLSENRAHVDSFFLRRRIDEISRDLLRLEVAYDDWQTLYRETLQLARALEGEPQLLAEQEQGNEETTMEESIEARPHLESTPEVVRQLSTTEILGEIASRSAVLVNKELALARTEIKQQLADEITTIKSAAIAAVAALVGVNLLFVAVVFALAPYVTPWLAALILAAVAFVAAVALAMVARSTHVSRPLEVTRQTLADDVRWAEERLA
jgi:uncharacterized protein YecA (UPF0149 family)